MLAFRRPSVLLPEVRSDEEAGAATRLPWYGFAILAHKHIDVALTTIL
jgi:hypothetical protein